MSTQQISHIFIIVGAVLMVLEFFLPGLISVFLGASSVVIGLLFLGGFICNIFTAVLFWFVLSLILLLTFRNVGLKFFPSEIIPNKFHDDLNSIEPNRDK